MANSHIHVCTAVLFCTAHSKRLLSKKKPQQHIHLSLPIVAIQVNLNNNFKWHETLSGIRAPTVFLAFTNGLNFAKVQHGVLKGRHEQACHCFSHSSGSAAVLVL